MTKTQQEEIAFTVSDWLGCIIVIILILMLFVWPFALGMYSGMYDDMGSALPVVTHLVLKTKLSSFLGMFTLVYFLMQFMGWVKSSIRRRRLWVVSSFIMSLLAIALCFVALYLPILKMAGAIG